MLSSTVHITHILEQIIFQSLKHCIWQVRGNPWPVYTFFIFIFSTQGFILTEAWQMFSNSWALKQNEHLSQD